MAKKKRYIDGTVFEKLSLNEQKGLRKEFKYEGQKNKALEIVTMVMAVLLVAIAFLSLLVERWIMLTAIPPVAFIIFTLILNEKNFVKWLKSEKNIIKK